MYKVWADELEENVRFDPKKSTQAWLQPPLILIKGSHTKQAMQEATKWSITCKGRRTGKRSHTLQIPRPLISFQVGGCMKWGWGGKSLALQRHCLFFFFFFFFQSLSISKPFLNKLGGLWRAHGPQHLWSGIFLQFIYWPSFKRLWSLKANT